MIAQSIKDEVDFVAWGDYALFTREETRTDRTTYPILTPTAGRGICDSIIWKPQMYWEVVEIAVLQPWWLKDSVYPNYMHIKRNEIKRTINARTIHREVTKKSILSHLDVTKYRTQRGSLILKNVAYLITAKPHILNCDDSNNMQQKYIHMLERRIRKGQYYRKPHFGCREFACFCRMPTDDDYERIDRSVNIDCGLMPHRMNYETHPPKPTFFHAIIRRGILNCQTNIVQETQP